MKKKLLSIVLALTLVFALVVPVNAESNSLQSVKDAYSAMIAAMDNKDLSALKTATESFTAANENLSDEEMEEFYAFAGEELLGVIFEAAGIVGMSEMIDAFNAEPTIVNAITLVDAYDSCYDGEMFDEEFTATLEAMIPNIHEVYAAALEILPEENVMSVYNAYLELEFVLAMQMYDEGFVAAMEGFETVLDKFNDLNEEELNQLAVLLGEEDGEAAFSAVLGTWINVNVINTMGELYNAFADDPNQETAAALIEYYDSIYNDPSYKDEELGELVDSYFGIHDVYEEALSYTADKKPESDKKPEADKEDSKDADTDKKDVLSPSTNDTTSYALPFVMLFIAAGAIVLIKKEKYN